MRGGITRNIAVACALALQKASEPFILSGVRQREVVLRVLALRKFFVDLLHHIMACLEAQLYSPVYTTAFHIVSFYWFVSEIGRGFYLISC